MTGGACGEPRDLAPALLPPVTVETEVHRQVVDTRHARHAADVAVTLGARDAGLHVHAVMEVHVRGHRIHASPAQRLVRAPALAHRCELGTIGPHLAVTAHAALGRWNAGE